MSFSRDVACIIAEYLSEYKLLDWIDKSMVCNDWLSANPNGLDFLLENKVQIHIVLLAHNTDPKAVDMFITSMLPTVEKLCFSYLLSNSTASEFIIGEVRRVMKKQEFSDISSTVKWLINNSLVTFNTIELYRNPSNELFNLIEPFVSSDEDLESIAMNPCDAAVNYIFNNLDRIKPEYLSANCNPKVLKYVIENNLVNFQYLSRNSLPQAIELLTTNPDRIDWNQLIFNPGAIELLKTHKTISEMLPWITVNPAIFELKSDQKIIDILIKM